MGPDLVMDQQEGEFTVNKIFPFKVNISLTSETFIGLITPVAPTLRVSGDGGHPPKMSGTPRTRKILVEYANKTSPSRGGGNVFQEEKIRKGERR